MPISIYPAKDTFMVGDTFYIDINTPTQMHNGDDDTYVDIAEHGIPFYINYYLITDIDSNRDIEFKDPGYQGTRHPDRNFLNRFDILSYKGIVDLSSPDKPILDFDIENGNFVNKSAIIIKDTGLFYFQFMDLYYAALYSYTNMHPDLNDGDCNEMWIQPKYYINDGKNNSYLLSDRNIKPFPNTSDMWVDIINNNFKHGSWAFFVKEK